MNSLSLYWAPTKYKVGKVGEIKSHRWVAHLDHSSLYVDIATVNKLWYSSDK